MATRDPIEPTNPGAHRKMCAGFSLVEALVVAVIMGILAAVAIPLYSSYATTQRQKTAESLAQTAAIAANSIYRRTNVDPTADEVKAVIFIPNPSNYTLTVNAGSGEISIVEHSGSPDVTGTAKYK